MPDPIVVRYRSRKRSIRSGRARTHNEPFRNVASYVGAVDPGEMRNDVARFGLTDRNSITLNNVTLANLSANDFLLV